jgi:D-alanine--poly(phosphoribitol) ligase subunit 1
VLYPNNNALFINNHYYTYKQLWQIVKQIHQQLSAQKQHLIFGVYCTDDIETYAAILAINLYGAAYVPLNSKFPVSKNKKIIEKCELQIVLTSVQAEVTNELKQHVDAKFINVVVISDAKTIKIKNEITINQNDYQKVEQPNVYILFTSGSTGEPKGVPISKTNVNHFFEYFLTNYNFNENDRFLQVYELTFDVSVFSFFMPLVVGACCYVLPTDGIKFIKTIEYLLNYKITVVSMVPTTLRYLENYLPEIKLTDLRHSFFSGDALHHNLAVKWSKAIPNAVIHNFYGPTETTIVCTRYVFNTKQSEKESVNNIVPLGKAFEGVEFIIIDENNIPTQKGELCFSGTQVITSYLNNTNEECFFTHHQKQYYKTGDIASVNEFGNLIFYGRTDSQVKINGYRVELTEVENAISKILDTRCVALTSKKNNSLNQLIVFIEKKTVDEKELKEKLQLILPDYMVPNQFIEVKNFVLNINGKIDKQHLLGTYSAYFY